MVTSCILSYSASWEILNLESGSEHLKKKKMNRLEQSPFIQGKLKNNYTILQQYKEVRNYV